MAHKRKRQFIETGNVEVGEAARTIDLPSQAAYRTVRPRPLRYDEKIKILWPGDPELEAMDNGAFANWLREMAKEENNEPLHHSKKRQLQHANLEKKILNKEQDEICIQVPNYRLLPIKDQPAQLEASGDPTAGEAAYIRLRGQTQDEIDNAVDYDLDSEDELWLNKRNAKSIADILSKDDLEKLIDSFEKAKHDIMEKRQHDWKREGPMRPAEAPDRIEPGILYSAAQAAKDLGDKYPSLTVRAAHNYWAKKAAASKLPLLQRFWYDKPWERLLALTKPLADDSSSGDEDGIPFQGKDSEGVHRVHHRKKAMDIEDIKERLRHARLDLERFRTIADQIRRREKIKKRQGKKSGKGAKIVPSKTKSIVKRVAEARAKANAGSGSGKPKHQGKSAQTASNKAQPAPITKEAQRTRSRALESVGQKRHQKVEKGKTIGICQNIVAAKQADIHVTIPLTGAGKEIKPSEQKSLSEDMDERVLSTGEHALPAGTGLGRDLPAGFSISLRGSSGKTKGYVEWQAKCRHGSFKLDRTSKIVKLFQHHAQCRPQWKEFACRPGEGKADYTTRMKEAFPFTRGQLVKQHEIQEECSQGRLTSILKAQTNKPVGPLQRSQKRSKTNKAQETDPGRGGPPAPAGQKRPLTRSFLHGAASAQETGSGKQSESKKPHPRKTSRGLAVLEGCSQLSAGDVQVARGCVTRQLGEGQAEAELQMARTRACPMPGGLDANGDSWDSSSGSDTYLPADSAAFSSEEEPSCPRRPTTRLSKTRLGRKHGREQICSSDSSPWPSSGQQPLSDQHSDESSLSGGSSPSLFSQEHMCCIKEKIKSPKQGLHIRSRGKKQSGQQRRNIVAAARQRTKQARLVLCSQGEAIPTALYLEKLERMAAKGSKYEGFIREAISTLKERTGSSLPAIKKYISQNHSAETKGSWESVLNQQLKRLTASGKLVKVKGSWKLGEALKKPPKKPAAKKTGDKKATTKKTEEKKPKEPKEKKPKAPKAEAAPAQDDAKPESEAQPKKTAAKPKKTSDSKPAKKTGDKKSVAKKGTKAPKTATTKKTPKKAAPTKKTGEKKVTKKSSTKEPGTKKGSKKAAPAVEAAS